VATALIILSTLGLEIVEPIYMEFMVEDFLISMSIGSPISKPNVESIINAVATILHSQMLEDQN
jgi:hypothetical protein